MPLPLVLVVFAKGEGDDPIERVEVVPFAKRGEARRVEVNEGPEPGALL